MTRFRTASHIHWNAFLFFCRNSRIPLSILWAGTQTMNQPNVGHVLYYFAQTICAQISVLYFKVKILNYWSKYIGYETEYSTKMQCRQSLQNEKNIEWNTVYAHWVYTDKTRIQCTATLFHFLNKEQIALCVWSLVIDVQNRHIRRLGQQWSFWTCKFWKRRFGKVRQSVFLRLGQQCIFEN